MPMRPFEVGLILFWNILFKYGPHRLIYLDKPMSGQLLFNAMLGIELSVLCILCKQSTN